MELSEPEIIARLQALDEYHFEQFVSELWTRMGWDTQVTSKSGDSGIDVIATRTAPYAEKELIQAKRYRPGKRVGGPEIQQYAALHNHEPDVDKVVVVTTSSFTDSALTNADRSNLKTIDGAKLARIIKQLDASDLVLEYTDAVDPDDIQRQSVQKQQQDAEMSSSGTEGSVSVISRSDDLTVELAALERVEASIGRSGLLSNPSQLEGFLTAFKLFNRTSLVFKILISEEIFAYDENGNRYSAIELEGVRFDSGWTPHDGSRVEIEGGSRTKYVVGFSMPKQTKVSRIEFPRLNINLDLDHRARQNISPLPEAITAHL